MKNASECFRPGPSLIALFVLILLLLAGCQSPITERAASICAHDRSAPHCDDLLVEASKDPVPDEWACIETVGAFTVRRDPTAKEFAVEWDIDPSEEPAFVNITSWKNGAREDYHMRASERGAFVLPTSGDMDQLTMAWWGVSVHGDREAHLHMFPGIEEGTIRFLAHIQSAEGWLEQPLLGEIGTHTIEELQTTIRVVKRDALLRVGSTPPIMAPCLWPGSPLSGST